MKKLNRIQLFVSVEKLEKGDYLVTDENHIANYKQFDGYSKPEIEKLLKDFVGKIMRTLK